MKQEALSRQEGSRSNLASLSEEGRTVPVASTVVPSWAQPHVASDSRPQAALQLFGDCCLLSVNHTAGE